MKKEMNQKWKKTLSVIISLLLGVIFGLLAVWTVGSDLIKKVDNVYVFMLINMGTFVLFFVVFFIDIILHEAGHCVMGLATGYQFGSFRVGSLMLVKYEAGLRFKKYTLPGTGGQCLLVPPAYNDGKFPFKGYYVGGILVNAVTTIIMLIVGFTLGIENYWGRFMLVSALVTGYLVAINTIPKESNDGALLFRDGKDVEQRKAIWECLQYAAMQQQGARPKDMPRIWEPMTDEELVAGVDRAGTISKLSARLGYLLDLQDYETVYTLLDKSLSNKKMMSILKQQFKIEKLFIEILLYNRKEEIEKLYDSELKAYIKQTSKTMIGTARFMYAYYLLVEKNEEKAQKEKLNFEKLCMNYPYAGDMAMEKDMMRAIDAKVQERTAGEDIA